MIAQDLALTSTGHGHPGGEVDRLSSTCIRVRSSERRAAYTRSWPLGSLVLDSAPSNLSSHRAACREFTSVRIPKSKSTPSTSPAAGCCTELLAAAHVAPGKTDRPGAASGVGELHRPQRLDRKPLTGRPQLSGRLRWRLVAEDYRLGNL